MDNSDTIAWAHRMRRALGIAGGQLVANPISATDEIPMAELAPVITDAQADAERQRINGKAVTPYLLQRIFDRTTALVASQYRLGAQQRPAGCQNCPSVTQIAQMSAQATCWPIVTWRQRP